MSIVLQRRYVSKSILYLIGLSDGCTRPPLPRELHRIKTSCSHPAKEFAASNRLKILSRL